jgi:hypothetical protein
MWKFVFFDNSNTHTLNQLSRLMHADAGFVFSAKDTSLHADGSLFKMWHHDHPKCLTRNLYALLFLCGSLVHITHISFSILFTLYVTFWPFPCAIRPREDVPILGFEGAFFTRTAVFKGETHLVLVTNPPVSYNSVPCSLSLCVSSNPLFLVPFLTQLGRAELRLLKALNLCYWTRLQWTLVIRYHSLVYKVQFTPYT